MAEIVNLNKARKAKLKQSEKLKAKENRVLFGVSTKARAVELEQREKALAKLEQHRLDLPENNKNS